MRNVWEFELDNGSRGTFITDEGLKGAKKTIKEKFHHRKLVAIEKKGSKNGK